MVFTFFPAANPFANQGYDDIKNLLLLLSLQRLWYRVSRMLPSKQFHFKNWIPWFKNPRSFIVFFFFLPSCLFLSTGQVSKTRLIIYFYSIGGHALGPFWRKMQTRFRRLQLTKPNGICCVLLVVRRFRRNECSDIEVKESTAAWLLCGSSFGVYMKLKWHFWA